MNLLRSVLFGHKIYNDFLFQSGFVIWPPIYLPSSLKNNNKFSEGTSLSIFIMLIFIIISKFHNNHNKFYLRFLCNVISFYDKDTAIKIFNINFSVMKYDSKKVVFRIKGFREVFISI